MSILLLLVFPVIISLFFFLYSNGKITWKEFLLQEVSLIVLITVSFFTCSFLSIQDREIWNGRIMSKDKQYSSCCSTHSCNCHEVCSGSGSSRSCSTACDTCCDAGNSFSAVTSNGEIAYDDFCLSPLFSDPIRWKQIKIGEPTSIEHSYTNYLKASDTILKKDANKEIKIPKYPKVFDYYRINRVLNDGVSADFSNLDNLLDELNADIGSSKQVNINIILTKEADRYWAENVRNEWIGGKKNDFIVVIGVPEYPKIKWAEVISWSDSEDCKLYVRNRIAALEKFDDNDIIKIISEEVEGKYVRKEMKDFNYLKYRIEPTKTVKIIIFPIGIILSIALSILFRKKEII
jgi:hypothetical protein